MPEAVDIQLIVTLALDSKQRGTNFIATGQDLLRKADGMLGYAQAHCKHEFEAPPAAYAHEGGTCKHCAINEQYAAQQKRQWLALEEAGLAPWLPRPLAKRPAKTKSFDDHQSIIRGLQRTDQ